MKLTRRQFLASSTALTVAPVLPGFSGSQPYYARWDTDGMTMAELYSWAAHQLERFPRGSAHIVWCDNSHGPKLQGHTVFDIDEAA